MPYHINWYQQDRVIFEKFYGDVVVEDVRNLNAQSSKMFIAGTPLIHVIVDLSEIQSFPKSMGVIKEAIRSRADPDRLGWVMIFGTKNPILKFFASVIAQVAGERVRFRLVNSLDEAVAFLHDQDQTLLHPLEPDNRPVQDDDQLPINP